MDLSSRCQILLMKINEFCRINFTDSDDTVKHALQQLLDHWVEVLATADNASDDEFFFLNISRAYLSNVFSIAFTKDCFVDDHSFTRRILRTCFDLLINYIDIFRNKSTTFLISNMCLIMSLSSCLVSLLRYSDIDLFTENEEGLFVAMREYVDQDFTHDDLSDGIISFIWNLTDNTLLVPLFLKAGYAQSMVEWMKTCQTKFREDKQNGLLSILVNMIRHDDGIDQFTSLDALNAIQYIPFDSTQSLQRTMIYILLTNINQIQLESLDTLNMLVQLIFDASRAEKYRHDGSHVCEPLIVLTKLFYNDEILVHTLCKIETKTSLTTQSIIELFASLLIQIYPNLFANNEPLENVTCVLVLNIVWLISYHQEYHQIIYTNEQLMSIINSLANNETTFVDTFMPRSMKDIQQAAIETLENLDRNNQ